MGDASLQVWRHGTAEFTFATGRLLVDGEERALDRSSRAILALLAENAGRPLGKDELLTAGWPNRIVHENSLAKAIGRLRQVLGPEAGAIEAVYGSGYVLKGSVEAVNCASVVTGTFSPKSGWTQYFPGSRLGWALSAGAALLAGLAGGAIGYIAAPSEPSEDRQQVEALVSYLSSDLLSSSDPYASSTEDKSVREVVERTAETMDRRFARDPATLLLLHRVVAGTFSGWGEYEKAVSHLDRARILVARLYGTGAEEAIPVDLELCQQLRLVGDTRRAERICLRAVQISDNHRSALLQSAQIAQAKLQFEIGEYAGVAETLGQVLSKGETLSDAERADAEWFYGLTLQVLARFDEADAAFRRHLEIRHRLNGDNHPLTAWAHSDYGDFLVGVGRYDDAQRHLALAERIFDARLGRDHPESLSPRYSRAMAFLWQLKPDQALAILRPMLARYRETLGSDHFWTLYVITETALAEAQTGGTEAAIVLLREARLTGARVLYGREGKSVYFHMRWARAFAALERREEAQDEARRAAASMDAAGFTPEHPWRARLHCISARTALIGNEGALAREQAGLCLEALKAENSIPQSYPALSEAQRLAAL